MDVHFGPKTDVTKDRSGCRPMQLFTVMFLTMFDPILKRYFKFVPKDIVKCRSKNVVSGVACSLISIAHTYT